MFKSNTIIMTDTVGQLMRNVFAWMSIGLCTTSFTAYALFSNPYCLNILLTHQTLFYLPFFAQIGLVIFLTSAIDHITYMTAAIAFFIYSALLGITLTPIFLLYTISSIVLAFGVTAAMFGSMALYGYFTESDLSKLGSILVMGLWGLIIALFANWYFQSSQVEYLISCAGIIIFTLLTAYDVQKIKLIAADPELNFSIDAEEKRNKIALLGALTLYLDFINLFLYLLRFMGKKKR